MRVAYVFAGLAVRDIRAATDWYTVLLGVEPDMRPNDAEAAWRLAESASLFLREDSRQPGNGMVTIVVADLDAEVARLRSARIDIGEPQPVGDAGRKAVVTDPDGNWVELVELS